VPDKTDVGSRVGLFTVATGAGVRVSLGFGGDEFVGMVSHWPV